MKQITVTWGGDAVTVDLESVPGSVTLPCGMLGKHVRLGGEGETWFAVVCDGPAEVMGMEATGDSAQEANDALSARMQKLAAWARGVFAKPPQPECGTCGTRIRVRRPSGAVRCRCGANAVAS